MHIVLSGQFLEAVNGVLFVIFLGMMAFFARWVFARLRSLRAEGRPIWYEIEPAVAWIFFLLGAAFIRGPIWVLRHLDNRGYVTDHLQSPAATSIAIGVVISILGGIWIIRTFASGWCGWVGPCALTVISLIFGIGFAYG